MSSAPTTFAVAVGGTSLILICLALMFRSGRAGTGESPRRTAGVSGFLNYASGDSGSHFLSWFS